MVKDLESEKLFKRPGVRKVFKRPGVRKVFKRPGSQESV